MNRYFIDLTGRRFGRWLVLSKTPQAAWGVSHWKCQCDCGRIKEHVLYTSLVSGNSRSCGCLRSELQMRQDHEVHSQRNPVFRVWQSMRTRCNNATHPSYKRYGGRGIVVCQRWNESFDAFLEDMGKPSEEGMSLDRIDNNGNYCKENCRWASRLQQAGNRSNNIKVSWMGDICNLIDVARKENVDYPSLNMRLKKGVDLREIVEALKASGKIFHERAEAFGGSYEPRTELRRPGRRKHRPENLPKMEKKPKVEPRKFGEPWENCQKNMERYELEKQLALMPKPPVDDPVEIRRKMSKREARMADEAVAAHDKKLWKAIRRCWELGITYRAKKFPSDWDWKLYSRTGPLQNNPTP